MEVLEEVQVVVEVLLLQRQAVLVTHLQLVRLKEILVVELILVVPLVVVVVEVTLLLVQVFQEVLQMEVRVEQDLHYQ